MDFISEKQVDKASNMVGLGLGFDPPIISFEGINGRLGHAARRRESRIKGRVDPLTIRQPAFPLRVNIPDALQSQITTRQLRVYARRQTL
jgi:hypothetical protein